MLLLLAIMVIAFICQFCIYQYYLQRYVHFILSKKTLWNNITEENELVIKEWFTFFM